MEPEGALDSPDSFGVRLLRGVGRRLLQIPPSLVWLPFLSWAGLIWWLSSREVIQPPSLIPRLPLLANLVHAFEFGLLALWTTLLFPRADGWPIITRATLARGIVPTLVYALVDEWHQSVVPQRDASLLDVLTDGVGIVSVLAVIAYLGQARADGSGLLRRLGLSLVGCLGAAWLATAYTDAFGAGPWPW